MSSKTASPQPANRPSTLKLFIFAGQASPSPPIGPALGQKGVKAMDFCRQFNDISAKTYSSALPLRTHITVNPDRTFSFQVRPPATVHLLKRAAGIEKASSKFTVARMSAKVVYEVAKAKWADPLMCHLPLQSVFKSVLATAKACGFVIF